MAKTSSTETKKAAVPAGRLSNASSAERKQALDSFASAMKLLQEGKLEKARAAFEKLSGSGQVDIAERSRVFLRGCAPSSAALSFSSPQEECDYAVSLLNDGNYPDAQKHFEAVLKRAPRADYAMYQLAVLHSITGNVDEALQMLSEAIEASPANRTYARSDADFHNIVDNPRFTELLYPEVL